MNVKLIIFSVFLVAAQARPQRQGGWGSPPTSPEIDLLINSNSTAIGGGTAIANQATSIGATGSAQNPAEINADLGTIALIDQLHSQDQLAAINTNTPSTSSVLISQVENHGQSLDHLDATAQGTSVSVTNGGSDIMGGIPGVVGVGSITNDGSTQNVISNRNCH